jgi:hypothetical protein
MISGKSIQQLAVEVSSMRERAQDYRLPQSVLRMNSDLNLLTVNTGKDLTIKPSDLMHSQLAEKLGVPAKYYNRMITEAPELLRANVNEWLGRGQEKRFVRTLAPDASGLNTGRAFLGAGYRPLDNYDMLSAIMPPLMNSGLAVKSSEITESRLYMQLVNDRITARVNAPHAAAKINDVVSLGLVVSNSEVGCGALSIQVLVYRLVCTNGMIVGKDLPGFRKVHVGREFEAPDAMLQDSTRKLRDAAIWSEARDVITHAMTQATLDTVVDRLNGIAAVKLENPENAVELVSKQFDLVESERNDVMRNLIAGGDVSQWGLLNAVTEIANTCKNYDRAIELETIGGKIASLPSTTFGAN